jgi:hypothetical protein
MTDTSAGHSDDHSSKVASGRTLSVAEFAGFIDDLIKCREDIIGELDLDNWLPSFRRRTNSGSDNALLRQRGIEDSLGSKLVLKPTCAAKDPSKSNILTEAKDISG